MNKHSFEFQLTELLNAHSIDNELELPDYIIARYIVSCIDSLEAISSDIRTIELMKNSPTLFTRESGK